MSYVYPPERIPDSFIVLFVSQTPAVIHPFSQVLLFTFGLAKIQTMVLVVVLLSFPHGKASQIFRAMGCELDTSFH